MVTQKATPGPGERGGGQKKRTGERPKKKTPPRATAGTRKEPGTNPAERNQERRNPGSRSKRGPTQEGEKNEKGEGERKSRKRRKNGPQQAKPRTRPRSTKSTASHTLTTGKKVPEASQHPAYDKEEPKQINQNQEQVGKGGKRETKQQQNRGRQYTEEKDPTYSLEEARGRVCPA